MCTTRSRKHDVTDDQLKDALKPYSYCGDQTDINEMRKEVGRFLLKAMQGYYLASSQNNIIKELNLIRVDATPNKRGLKFLFDAFGKDTE